MKINISSAFAFLSLPIIYISALIPISAGSLFDITVLPLLAVYGLSRFIFVIPSLSISIPVYCYTFILALVFFLRFIGANVSDIMIAGTGLRLIMPIFSIVFFVDFFRYISKLDSYRKANLVMALMASFLFLMIGIMILSFHNGIGAFGLGLSFPFYTEEQIDRHVYGPTIASLVIFGIICISSFKKNIVIKQLLPLIFASIIIGVASSFASGSRSPLAMYSVAIAYALASEALRSRHVLILKIIIGSLLVFAGVLIFQQLISGEVINGSSYASLIDRAFGFFQSAVNPVEDHSRSGVYLGMIDKYSNVDYWLSGQPTTIGAADSGPMSLFLNGGFPLLISFGFLWFSILYILPYSVLKIFLISVLGQFLVGSETLFIPRYFLIIAFEIFLFAIFMSFPFNTLKIQQLPAAPLMGTGEPDY